MLLKPCPFCGGKAKIHGRQIGFAGQNYLGNKRLQWSLYVACNKCHARGKPISTNFINLNDDENRRWDTGNFYASAFWRENSKNCYATQTFEPYAQAATEAWNRRGNDD